MARSMISIRNVSKWYGAFRVLTDCSTEVAKAEVVVVCGPSGSGKSTLVKCVNGLEPFQKGEIFVDGISVGDPKTDLPKLRSRVGMVFQHFELFPHMTVMQNLTLAQVKVLRRSAEEARDKGMKLLERVGLADQRDKFPAQLSGGQQQRVAIARALANSPELLLADEPTGQLDSQTGRGIMQLIRDLVDAHRVTALVASHDPIVLEAADRILQLSDGTIVDDAPGEAARNR